MNALSKATALDYDGNQVDIIETFPSHTFTDMTSNQALVAGALAANAETGIPKAATVEAAELVENEVPGAKGRDIAAVAVDIMVSSRHARSAIFGRH